MTLVLVDAAGGGDFRPSISAETEAMREAFNSSIDNVKITTQDAGSIVAELHRLGWVIVALRYKATQNDVIGGN